MTPQRRVAVIKAIGLYLVAEALAFASIGFHFVRWESAARRSFNASLHLGNVAGAMVGHPRVEGGPL